VLKALTIQQLAIVRHLDVEFENGLTILTGETGAGKSILIEALGLALGDRADSSMVRTSADRASVSATFDIASNIDLKAFLRNNDLEDSDECLLRRVMSPDGRSRAFCNASPIPVQLLKQIGEFLVDIHGQHAHQSLLRGSIQRSLLDEFGSCNSYLHAVEQAYHQWRDIGQQLDELSHGGEDVPRHIDLLQFQAKEIEALKITEENLAELEVEHRYVGHAARLIEGYDSAETYAFNTEGGALEGTIKAAGTLRDLIVIDAGLVGVVELLDQAAINLEEAEHEFSRLRANIETDPKRLQEIDKLLGAIHDIARKHRCEPKEIPERLKAIRLELDALDNREGKIRKLSSELDLALNTYTEAAKDLHKHRFQAAKKMDNEITKHLRELGIPHGNFSVSVEPIGGTPSPHGDDEIEFLVTANPDLPIKPLKKVASGGELSRISLAIQVATTGSSGIPVLVFDEVDTGVSGATAEVVSEYLQHLANKRQILCITHLPQVASAGDHHFSIGKTFTDGITETTITDLEPGQRVEEVARMLGGQRITNKAREHARELLTQ
jgi:DNA repair protein RecN (Recombination protein N)